MKLGLTREHGSQTQELVTTTHLGRNDEHLGELESKGKGSQLMFVKSVEGERGRT